MSTQVKPARWEDLVFESRNKAYGAYQIRYVYGKHLIWGIIITILVSGLALGYPKIKELLASKNDDDVVVTRTVKYTDLLPPPPIDKNTPPPPEIDIPKVQKQIKFLPPKVTEKEVVEEEPMPTIDEIKQNDVGATDIEGTTEVIFEEPVAAVVKEEEDEDKVFLVVEQPAEFDGGMAAMYKYIGKNLKYPASARRMGIEGSVFISFIVDKAGVISDVQVVKGISADCDKEAARVVKGMPNWKPGKQNGRAVKSKFVLPIKFKLAS
jgi:protein TonB